MIRRSGEVRFGEGTGGEDRDGEVDGVEERMEGDDDREVAVAQDDLRHDHAEDEGLRAFEQKGYCDEDGDRSDGGATDGVDVADPERDHMEESKGTRCDEDGGPVTQVFQECAQEQTAEDELLDDGGQNADEDERTGTIGDEDLEIGVRAERDERAILDGYVQSDAFDGTCDQRRCDDADRCHQDEAMASLDGVG